MFILTHSDCTYQARNIKSVTCLYIQSYPTTVVFVHTTQELIYRKYLLQRCGCQFFAPILPGIIFGSSLKSAINFLNGLFYFVTKCSNKTVENIVKCLCRNTSVAKTNTKICFNKGDVFSTIIVRTSKSSFHE